MNLKTRSVRLSYMASLTALALVGTACSSDKDNSPSTASGSPLESALTQLQQAELQEGRSLSITLPTSLRLVESNNSNALKVEQQGQELRLEGLSYGVSAIRLKDEERGQEGRAHVVVDGERPRIAIEYFAPYNVNEAGTGLATPESGTKAGLFRFYQAQALNIQHEGATYRTPSQLELRAIFPYNEGIEYYLPKQVSYFEEVVKVAGEVKRYAESYYSPGKGVAYALRFAKPNHGRAQDNDGIAYAQDNSLRTAYRYEYTPDPEQKGAYMMVITARYLGEHFDGGLPVVANEGFWYSGRKSDVRFVLPNAGYQRQSDTGKRGGFISGAEYHSSELSGKDDLGRHVHFGSWALNFHRAGGSLTLHADTMTLRPIRPIRN